MASPPFEELLRQLREAHAREVWELREENATLSARLEPLVRPGADKRELQDQEEVTAPSPRLQPMARQCTAKLDIPDELPQDGVVSASSNSWRPERDPMDGVVSSSSKAWRSRRLTIQSNTRSSSLSFDENRRQRSWLRRHHRTVKRTFVFEDIAPRTLNLQLLCVEKFPDAQWGELTVRQKVELLREALRPKHQLIDPHSVFMRWWDIILAICLLQVGIFTPYEVVFMRDYFSWSLFGMNALMDLIFVMDMVIQFFLVSEVQRPNHGGTMFLRDPWTIRKRYLTSWFLVDIVSIIPFDVFNLVWHGRLPKQAKMMRIVKLFRLAKLLRMLRSSKMVKRWRNGIGMTFAAQKLIQFMLTLGFVSHWMACVWGFTGLLLGADLCDEGGQPVTASVAADDVSWVTTLYLGGKISPDSPCSPFAVYAASLHWAIMTLTSIGYGDIVPVRLEEYLVCILCMLLGGVLWAYVIGSLCSIVSNRSLVQQDFEANTDLLNLAMSEAEVPQKERPKYREFLREARVHDRSMRFSEIASSFSPLLRQELMFHTTKHVIRAVSYLRTKDVPRKLLTAIASVLDPKFFSRGEHLDTLRHDLCLVDRGTVAHNEQVMVPPSVLHEDFIIEHKYKRPATTMSLTYVQVLVLTRDAFDQLLSGHPDFSRTIRICAAKMAFCNAMLTIRESYMEMLASQGGVAMLSLCEAFDSVFGEAKSAVPMKIPLKSQRSRLTLRM